MLFSAILCLCSGCLLAYHEDIAHWLAMQPYSMQRGRTALLLGVPSLSLLTPYLAAAAEFLTLMTSLLLHIAVVFCCSFCCRFPSAVAQYCCCCCYTSAGQLVLLLLPWFSYGCWMLENCCVNRPVLMWVLTGGLLWFSDLCQPALNLAAATAPLGSVGVILPAGVAVAMFANIQRSFGVTPNAQGGCQCLSVTVCVQSVPACAETMYLCACLHLYLPVSTCESVPVCVTVPALCLLLCVSDPCDVFINSRVGDMQHSWSTVVPVLQSLVTMAVQLWSLTLSASSWIAAAVCYLVFMLAVCHAAVEHLHWLAVSPGLALGLVKQDACPPVNRTNL